MSALAAVNDGKIANQLKVNRVNSKLAKAKELKKKNAQLVEQLLKASLETESANKKARDLAAEKGSVEQKLQDAVKEAQEAAKREKQLKEKNKLLNEKQTALSNEKDVISSKHQRQVAAYKQLEVDFANKGVKVGESVEREKQLKDKNKQLAEKIKESSSANDKCQTARTKLQGEVDELKSDVRDFQSMLDEIDTDDELQHIPSLKF